MKTLISLSLFAATSALACDFNEALVAGPIADIEIIEPGQCRVFVDDFSFYSEHALCPLSESVARAEGILMFGKDCEPGARTQISGVLQDDGVNITLDG